jgi:hypothetical protein
VLLSFLAALLFPQAASGSGLDSLLTIFPSRKLVREFAADGTAHRFSIGKAFQANHIYGSIGGTLPLFESPIVGQGIQAGFGVSVSTTMHPHQNIAIISTEFYVDYLMIDIVWTDNLFSRLAFGHTSHHLGDNAFSVLQKSEPVDYSRDYVEGFMGYMDSSMRVYAGVNYGYGFIIDHPENKKWMFQTGIEVSIMELGIGLMAYGAMDMKFRQELQYGSTVRIQAGIQFQNGSDRLIRLALTHQTGLEERGQFHGQRIVVTTIGLMIEF